MYVIKVEKPEGTMYFTKKCGPKCVAFSGQLDSQVQKYKTEQEAWDEIDWLIPEYGTYEVIHIKEIGKSNRKNEDE